MSSIVDILTSAVGGSMIGAIGAAFNKVYESKHQLKMAEIDLRRSELDNSHEKEMAQITATGKREEAEAALALADTTAGYAALQSSIESDKATYSSINGSKWLVFVDVIRGTMRPWLTTALIVYLGLFLLYLNQRYNIEFTTDQVMLIVMQILQCLTTGASLALAWWFGSKTTNRKE